VNFDDQDWDLEDQASLTRPEPAGGWKIAAGVGVGIVIGGLLMAAIDHRGAWQAAVQQAFSTQAMRPVAKPLPTAAPQPPLRLPAEPTGAGVPAGRQESPAAAEPPRAAAANRSGEPQEAERLAALAQQAALQAIERKERAWALFYKKPAACDEIPPKASMVECANHFIRAKREFEQLYEAGKLAPARPVASASRSASGP